MKPKQIITALLLAFVGVSVVFLVVKETRSRPENVNPVGQTTLAQEPASTAPPTENSAATEIPQASPKTPDGVPAPSAARAKSQPSMPDRTVVAYYFHGNFRCQTCRKIEAFSGEAVKSGFPEDLKAGRLEWRVINVEEPGNEHFIQDYQLFSKSLVLVAKEGSKQTRWKNLQRVWTLVGDKDAFIQYVQVEIRAYLRGA
jgi:hypothetical protein